MDKMKMYSMNKIDENVKKIATLFPECITEIINDEGKLEKVVDIDAFRQLFSKTAVEGTQERYQFTWPDKRKAKALVNQEVTSTLRPCREESVNFDTTENLYIEGDNLEVLKLLQETYLGKIKMIYIDPPYNTGNDFVYEDDFSQNANNYVANSGQYDNQGNRLVTNTESNGRFHTDWLNMMYPRLKLSKDLLSEDGLIFISIDENEISNLNKLCCEIFGSEQFIGQITLLCNPKGRSQDMYIANCHEYLLIYSKTKRPSGAVSIPKTEEEIRQDYTLIDNKGLYRELELRNTHRDFGKFNRPNLWYPIYVDSTGRISLSNKDGYDCVFPVWDDGFEGCWTWSLEKAKKEIDSLTGRKVNGKWKVYRKSYAIQDGENVTKQVKSIWDDKSFFTEKGQACVNKLFGKYSKIFQAPKSVNLLMQCIQMAKSENQFVLDFFSGSATTAHAVMQLNAEDGGHRKFIMVQLPEKCDEKSEACKAGYKNICEIGKERIRRAGKQILDELKEKNGDLFADDVSLDIGFRDLKLDSSNMNDVYYTPEAIDKDMLDGFVSNIKEDRTTEDLLFQVMLDLGVLLSAKISEEEIAGKKVFNVDKNYLIACFDEDVNEDVIIEAAKKKPTYFVMRDSSLANDSVSVNFDQIFARYSPDTVRKVL